MKKFTFYWLDGKRQVFEGRHPADALNRAGYGGGALRALDFCAKGDNHDYVWSAGAWVKTQATASASAPSQ